MVYNKNGSVKSASINHNGYLIINFYVNHKRKGFSVHTIVAKTFIENLENKSTVNHIDGNKLNNSIENLEWATYSEQTQHSINILNNKNIGKWNVKPIIAYDKKTKEIKYVFNSLAEGGRYFANGKNYRYYQSNIYRAIKGIRKTYKNCI